MTNQPPPEAAETVASGSFAAKLRSIVSTPLYPAIAVGSHVLSQASFYGVPITAAFRPMAVIVAIMLAAQLLLATLFGRHRGSYVAATAVTFIGGAIFTCLALLAVAVARLVLRIRSRAKVPTWLSTTRGLNVLSAALLMVTLVSAWTSETFVLADADTHTGQPSLGLPNIYVLMLDGYPRSDTLDGWDYDNEPFLGRLEALGFEISHASHSNYMETWLSVASMADLRHLRAESLGGAFSPNRRFTAVSPSSSTRPEAGRA